MLDPEKFGTLTGGHRIWAVAAIHGEAGRLRDLHAALAARIQPRDRLVYLGNYLGHGGDIIGTVDELIAFRREVLCVPGMMPQDVVFLRGVQEEMWQKLLQLQLAMNPPDVLGWMMERGVTATIKAYGGTPGEGLAAARGGTVTLTRWTSGLRSNMYAHPGHRELMSQLKRACVTQEGTLLFVHAGIDPERPLETQRDAFWWNPGGFAALNQSFGHFRLVVRGFDPDHEGVRIGPYTATLDGGCGNGGPLVACCFDNAGQPLEQVEA
jgi:serine/threonine protein phosphatase 1